MRKVDVQDTSEEGQITAPSATSFPSLFLIVHSCVHSVVDIDRNASFLSSIFSEKWLTYLRCVVGVVRLQQVVVSVGVFDRGADLGELVSNWTRLGRPMMRFHVWTLLRCPAGLLRGWCPVA